MKIISLRTWAPGLYITPSYLGKHEEYHWNTIFNIVCLLVDWFLMWVNFNNEKLFCILNYVFAYWWYLYYVQTIKYSFSYYVQAGTPTSFLNWFTPIDIQIAFNLPCVHICMYKFLNSSWVRVPSLPWNLPLLSYSLWLTPQRTYPETASAHLFTLGEYRVLWYDLHPNSILLNNKKNLVALSEHLYSLPSPSFIL